MKLELDSRLRVFAAIARQHSFSRAAAELLISQPAVSHHIAELEKTLGLQLVIRRAHAAELTEAGEYLAQHVLRAEALLAQATQGLKAFTRDQAPAVHLAASGTPGNYLLPPVLSAYRQAYPQTTIEMSLGTSQAAIQAVRTHQADLGVVGGLADFEDVEVEPVCEDEIILIGPPDLAGQAFSPASLRSYTWLTREPGSSTRAVVEAAWRDLGIRPRKRITLPSWEAIKLAVASGSGIAACSRLAVGPELASGMLARLDAPRWRVHRTISLIKLAGVELSNEAGSLWEMIRRQARATQTGRISTDNKEDWATNS